MEEPPRTSLDPSEPPGSKAWGVLPAFVFVLGEGNEPPHWLQTGWSLVAKGQVGTPPLAG